MTIRAFITVSLFMAFLCLASKVHAEVKPPEPLFASDGVITITIEAPFSDLISTSRRSINRFPAKLDVKSGDEGNHVITIEPRGNTRRTKGICKFPPLKIRFLEKPKTGLFKGQKNLKLVTHCRDQDSYEQNSLVEYSAYRLFNVMSEQSLNVRLARIDYVDITSREILAQRYGFFIEDMDHAAKRNGMVELDLPNILNSQLQNDAAAKIALFQYMIGNVDWSLSSPAPDDNCCHNSKLMAPTTASTQDLIAVPYDFDNSGLVNPPYALLPEGLEMRNIRTRLFRGRCTRSDDFTRVVPQITDKEADLLGILDDIPGLAPKRKDKAKSYLSGFFEVINSPKSLKRNIHDKCQE